VEPAAKGFVIGPTVNLSPGSWKKQGMPFYGHQVSYETELEVSREELEEFDFIFKQVPGPEPWPGFW